MSDENIRRLAREWSGNPCPRVCNALGRVRARMTVGVVPTARDDVYQHVSGIELVHVPDRAIFIGRFPVMVAEYWRIGVAKRETRGRPVLGFTELHPIILDHDRTMDYLDVIGARLPRADEWRHVMLGHPWTCDHRDARTTLYRTEPGGARTLISCDGCGMSDPPKARSRTRPWDGMAPNPPATVWAGDWVITAGVRTEPVLVCAECLGGACVNTRHWNMTPARRGTTWCGAMDVAHVRERVTVESPVPGKPHRAVIGGSRLHAWSAEASIAGTFQESNEQDEFAIDVGFRICVDAGGPR